MTQTHSVRGVATHIGRDSNGKYYVQYHSTRVVEWNESIVILDSGGWRTATTRTRMNQTANQFGLGFRVFQKKGEWFVCTGGQTIPFEDGIVLKKSEEGEEAHEH